MPLNSGPLNSAPLNGSYGATAPVDLTDPHAQFLVVPEKSWSLPVPAKQWILKV